MDAEVSQLGEWRLVQSPTRLYDGMTMAATTITRVEPASEELELSYQLAELPSSQHRAGLAGLVLMVDWLKHQPGKQGKCEIVGLDAQGATLKVDRQGLEDLFNEVYGASTEELERKQPRRNNKTNAIIPPLKEETRSVVDAKGHRKEQSVSFTKRLFRKARFY